MYKKKKNLKNNFYGIESSTLLFVDKNQKMYFWMKFIRSQNYVTERDKSALF